MLLFSSQDARFLSRKDDSIAEDYRKCSEDFSSTIIHLNFSLLVLVQIHALKRLQVYLSQKAFTVHISSSSVRN